MKKTQENRKWTELDMEDIDSLLAEAKAQLSEESYEKLEAIINSLAYLTDLVEDKKTTIKKLRELLFGHKTEKTSKVLQKGEREPSEDRDESKSDREKAKGHGRNGAKAYTGAKRVQVSHDSLHQGAPCPDCDRGKVYLQSEPKVLVRLIGRSPIGATVYELERYRCNLCGKVFTAAAPEGTGSEKYDASVGVTIGLLKYGSGLPFNRLEGLQRSLGIPLPASTQWDIVEKTADILRPVYKELIREAAQGEVVYNDDTTAKILSLMKENEAARAVVAEERNDPKERDRTGIFTSGIVSTREGKKITLFFTGRQHAGENLKDVLAQRNAELEAPLQMCDALSRNLPEKLEVIVSNCLVHARRNFVTIANSFPDDCQYVIESIAKIYKNEENAKGLNPNKRLEYHKKHSKPVMDELKEWFDRQFDEKKVEPNSGLGQAIQYMTKRWDRFTLFLRKPGAPLDNNVCERTLKKAILHRRNSLFFKTENGAVVGDIFMSMIHTCQVSGINPFDYLIALRKNADKLSRDPKAWLPWNYDRAQNKEVSAEG